MKLVLGLGNPGTGYHRTRHNAGFEVVRELERRQGLHERREGSASITTAVIAGAEVLLARPRTFMNESGRAAAQLVHRRHLEDLADLLVVHDDMDLGVGTLRLRSAGSEGGHNGVRSIIGALRTRSFARLRVGIGRPPLGEDPIDYVLGPFTSQERTALAPVLVAAADAVEYWVEYGIGEAMNRFNNWRADRESQQ